MIRAIFWKEWHEHRSKYLSYWAALNIPILILALALGLSVTARIPFADLTNSTVLKYLPLSEIESAMVLTIFLILTGYLAVATFSPEIEDRSLFFMYEQPLPRKLYVAIKFLNGACHVVVATGFAILFFPVAAYGMMLLSGKVTTAGSSGAFALVMAMAGRAAVWCALVSLAAFSASALVSALVPRWWLAAVCSVVLGAAAIGWGGNFFFFDPFPENGDTMSVSAGFGTGHAKWIEVTRALKPSELNAIAHWQLWPLLTSALLTVLFCAAVTFLYDRKELK